MTRVMIVGAGPVGMFLAYEINRLDSSVKIDIFEKRRTYTREQIVILNSVNIRRLPSKIRGKLYGKNGKGCYVKPPPL